MSHASAVAEQDNTATVPVKTIDELVLEGSAELIVIRAIETINGVLKHFSVDHRVPADDARLNDVAASLAKAIRAEQNLGEELAEVRDQRAALNDRFAEYAARMEAILANRRLVDLDSRELRRFVSLGEECCSITRLLTMTQTARTQLDAGTAAAEVARCTDELCRAEHGILMEIMAGHVDRAERALLEAVAAMREVARIGVKHLGPDVGEEYIPGAGIVALLAG